MRISRRAFPAASFRAALLAVACCVTPAASLSAQGLQDALAKGCDYERYVAKFNEAANGVGWLRSQTDVSAWFGAPTTDVLTALATKAAGEAEERQAAGQVKAMLAQFESACQHWATARNVERQVALVKIANRGIQKLLTLTKVDTRIQTVKVDGRLAVRAESIYAMGHRSDGDPSGMGEVLDSTALQALRSASLATTMLDSNIKALESLKLDLNEYASYDATARKYVCSDTTIHIPSPLPSDYPTVAGRGLVCGPVSPGRAQQIMAAAGVINAQNAAILGGLHASGTALRAATAVQDTRQSQKKANSRDVGWASVRSAY